MSAIYDNWERLVGAVLKKEQLWQLFHADSIEPSISSSSWATSSSFYLGSPMSDLAAASNRIVHPAYSRDVLLQKNESLGFNTLALDYETMLSTSAVFETLRNEKFAVAYRSVMDDGITTVVKRLRGASVEAYFSHKDEMLIIYEYQSRYSVSSILMHGETHLLDWESRVRIAIAVARAIADTHSQKLARGDTKPKDTFSNSRNKDCFSDLGLENMAASSVVIPTAGYRPPETNYYHRPSQASDVYTFGVLLLELLTGAFPVNGNAVNRMHLVRLVTDKFLELGTLLVFEFVPVRNPTALIEMWKMLLVAIFCVEEDPEQRPKSSDVVKMMEDIKRCPSSEL